MRSVRWVLLAMLLALPFAVAAHAQVMWGVGVGPVLVAAPDDYSPPVCDWGYYAYYPYACAPYGYYGPNWFYGGVFIGAGPWYHRGWYGGRGWGGHGWGARGGYGRPTTGGTGRGVTAPRGAPTARGGFGGRSFSAGGRSGGFSGGGRAGGFGGGHMGGGGGHGGGHR